jgi:uncharacterized protein YybS (DUF2232 family)
MYVVSSRLYDHVGPCMFTYMLAHTLQVSMGLAVSESDFYLVKDSFISNIATLLGINPKSINIVDVVSGNARRSLPEIGDATAGDGTEDVKTHSRALLAESVTVSFEIVPEASLSVSDISAMENQRFANMTIVRSANVSSTIGMSWACTCMGTYIRTFDVHSSTV